MTKYSNTNKKKYVKASDAARLVGYSSDHVSRLARAGEIEAQKRGNSWYVDPDSVKLFSLKIEAEKRERSKKIREERLQDRAVATRRKNDAAVLNEIGASRQHALLQTAAFSAALFLLFNLGWFAFESRIHVANLAGGVRVVVSDISDQVSFPLPSFFSQVASFAFIDRRQESIEEQQRVVVDDEVSYSSESPRSGIVIFDGASDMRTIEAMRESFSDEVEIEFDAEDTGIITPVFRERSGESYRFLLVPVDERES